MNYAMTNSIFSTIFTSKYVGVVVYFLANAALVCKFRIVTQKFYRKITYQFNQLPLFLIYGFQALSETVLHCIHDIGYRADGLPKQHQHVQEDSDTALHLEKKPQEGTKNVAEHMKIVRFHRKTIVHHEKMESNYEKMPEDCLKIAEYPMKTIKND